MPAAGIRGGFGIGRVLIAAWTLAGLLPPAAAHDPGGWTLPAGDARFLAAKPALPVIGPAPDFVLRDGAGEALRLSELRGSVVLLSFIFTSCTTACPLLTQQMALLQDRLDEAGIGPGQVRFLSVTVDPERDSAKVLGTYAASFDADAARWQFLREQPDRLGVMLTAYDEWTRALPSGDIDHPARVYLIDRAGRIREIYSLAFFDERQAFLDIRALLSGPQ